MPEMGKIDADVHIAICAKKMDDGGASVERLLCFLPENGVIQSRCEFSKKSIVQIIRANRQRVVTLPQDATGNYYQGLDVQVAKNDFLRTDDRLDHEADELGGIPIY